MARRQLLTFDRKAHDKWGYENNTHPYVYSNRPLIECDYCRNTMFKAPRRRRNDFGIAWSASNSGFARLRMNNTFICEECMDDG